VGSGILPISRQERGIKCPLSKPIAKSAINPAERFPYMTHLLLVQLLAGNVSLIPAMYAMVKVLLAGYLQMVILILNIANATHYA